VTSVPLSAPLLTFVRTSLTPPPFGLAKLVVSPVLILVAMTATCYTTTIFPSVLLPALPASFAVLSQTALFLLICVIIATSITMFSTETALKTNVALSERSRMTLPFVILALVVCNSYGRGSFVNRSFVVAHHIIAAAALLFFYKFYISMLSCLVPFLCDPKSQSCERKDF
jgi:hypothetical protein